MPANWLSRVMRDSQLACGYGPAPGKRGGRRLWGRPPKPLKRPLTVKLLDSVAVILVTRNVNRWSCIQTRSSSATEPALNVTIKPNSILKIHPQHREDRFPLK
jgi:hypothetical protein